MTIKIIMLSHYHLIVVIIDDIVNVMQLIRLSSHVIIYMTAGIRNDIYIL
jgi:hypothetical protein